VCVDSDDGGDGILSPKSRARRRTSRSKSKELPHDVVATSASTASTSTTASAVISAVPSRLSLTASMPNSPVDDRNDIIARMLVGIGCLRVCVCCW
jgi:hypothetical protein